MNIVKMTKKRKYDININDNVDNVNNMKIMK